MESLNGALALLGGITGPLGFILAWLGYRRDRVKLKITVGSKTRRGYIFWIHEGIGLTVRVNNLGRAECEVINGWWVVDDKRSWDSAHPRAVDNRPAGSSRMGPRESPFPITVPGLAAREWQTRTPKRPEDRTREAYKMRYVALLGHDKKVQSRWILTMSITEGQQPDPCVYDRLAFPRRWRPIREILGLHRSPLRTR